MMHVQGVVTLPTIWVSYASRGTHRKRGERENGQRRQAGVRQAASDGEATRGDRPDWRRGAWLANGGAHQGADEGGLPAAVAA